MSTRDDPRIAAILPDYRRWLHAVANDMLPPGSPDHDDLVQEGLLAMWKALARYDPQRGEPGPFLRDAARNRMLSIRAGRAPTGAPERQRAEHGDSRGAQSRRRIREHLAANPNATGREIANATGLSEATVSFHRKRLLIDDDPPTVSSLDALLDAGLDVADCDATVSAVIAAYHHGEIAQALDALTPLQRRYVVLRFWHGLGTAEMVRKFGYDPRGVWRGVQARLRESLAHLVAA